MNTPRRSLFFSALFRPICLGALVVLATTVAHAVVYTWDPDSSAGIQPGSGTWNTTVGNAAWTSDGGDSQVLWSNAGGHSAVFAGGDAGGTIALSTGITLSGTGNSISFLNSGYTLQSDGGSVRTISFSNGTSVLVAAGKSMTVGSNVTMSNAVIGAAGTANGTVNIDAGGKLISSGTMALLGDGTSIQLKTGGSIAAGGSVLVGNSSGDHVTLVLDGGSLTTSGVNGNLSLINTSSVTNASATVTLDSGEITLGASNSSKLVLGSASSSTVSTTFNLNGGTLSVGSISESQTSGTGTVSTFNFNGGVLKTGSTNVLSTGSGSFMTGLDNVYVKAGGARIDTGNGVTANNITIASDLRHDSGLGSALDGGLEKFGAGMLTLTGNNTYTGATVVTAGGLATGATGTFGNGNISVGAGASLTLGNSSSIADAALLVFDSTSTVNLSFIGEEILGGLQLSGGSSISSGTYTDAQLNEFFGGSVFSGGGLLTIAAIPEPSTWALLLGGISLASACMFRPRRHARD